jgi:hypothetical protein
MSEHAKRAAWSALTTFIATAAVALGALSVADVNLSAVTAILISAGTAALRTGLAALDPNQTLYGRGAQ